MPYTVLDRIQLFMNGVHDELRQAECYLHGIYVERDPRTALMLYKRAVAKNLPGAHFKLGLYYHHQRGKDKKAVKAYYNALQAGDLCAMSALEELAKSGSVAAHLCLGSIYEDQQQWQKALDHHEIAARGGSVPATHRLVILYQGDRISPSTRAVIIKKNIEQEIYWLREAAMLNSTNAQEVLTKYAASNAQAAFYFAQVLESKGDPEGKAIKYYSQANVSGHIQATFELGKIYETGRLKVKIDKINASKFYLLAFKRGCREALREAERLITILGDSQLEYELAEIYQNVIKDKSKGLVWYKKSAEQGCAQAATRLYEIASSDAEFAYTLGQGYEKNKYMLRAFIVYALAMRNNHMNAKKALEAAAFSNNPDAQYALGSEYYHHKGEIIEAIKWCMRAAESGQQQALKYLTETPFTIAIYVWIAECYEHGAGVRVDMRRALNFYIKAYESGSTDTALLIAKKFEKIPGDREENINYACKYYIEAVSHGHHEVLPTLERLAESASKDIQRALAQLYCGPVVNQPMKSFYWKQKYDKRQLFNDNAEGSISVHVFKLPAINVRPIAKASELKEFVAGLS